MNQQDRAAIDGVFGRLSELERQGVPRDAEADKFITSRVNEQPGAAYYLAQTVVVQEQALKAAQDKITQLEQQSAPKAAAANTGLGYSFGRAPERDAAPVPGGAPGAGAVPGSVTGAGAVPGAAAGAAPNAGAAPAAGGLAGAGFGRGAGGGGFLAGAMQTAMGVAGGMMLGSLLGNMLGGNHANAAEPPAETAGEGGDVAAADQGPDAGADQVSYDDPGFDDGGGFDGGFDDI
ncbi:MAG: DUF2076 domain-containing protein [Achromobacter sp.]